jgi:hypothetical protein
MSLTTWELHGFLPHPTPDAAQVDVRLPPLEEVVEHWTIIGPLLHKATSRNGCYEPLDLLQMAMAGQAGIWVCEVDGFIEAAVVTRVTVFPRRRILEMMAVGGSGMRHWIEPLRTAMRAHAREIGCSHIASVARPGWLRAWGATPTGDIGMVCNIEDTP